jgi:hypothetical protein
MGVLKGFKNKLECIAAWPLLAVFTQRQSLNNKIMWLSHSIRKMSLPHDIPASQPYSREVDN